MKLVTLGAPLLLAALASGPAQAQMAPAPPRQPAAVPSATAARSALAPRFDPTLQATFALATATADRARVGLPLPKYGRWVGITKWLTLAGTVGLGGLGIKLHNDAQDLFDRLDRLCKADADNCRSRNRDGSYTDPLLESTYQDVLSRDRRARAAFIGAELGFGVSVVLFIVDFQKKKKGPGNVPYDPDSQNSALRLTAVPGELALRYYPR
jgi:hypothetical protein